MRCVANDLIVSGILKGYDQLMNLVLDDVKEKMRGMSICPVFFRPKY
jgi:small nuclear ribonucleoprotein (snRNP)-like protein